MILPKVSIVEGKSPGPVEVLEMVRKAADLLGGMTDIVKEGDTVALKPTVLTGKLSGPGVTTDPMVIEALIKLAFEAGACSACRGTIQSVFYEFEQMGKMDEIRDLVILVGPQAELPKDLEQKPLIMGVCLQHLKDEGCYVVGCPPNNDKMREAIIELTNVEP